MRRDAMRLAARPPHDKRQRRQAQNDHRHDPETVLETQRARLRLHGLVRHRQRFLRCSGRIVALRQEQRFQPAQELFEIRVRRIRVRSERCVPSVPMMRAKPVNG